MSFWVAEMGIICQTLGSSQELLIQSIKEASLQLPEYAKNGIVFLVITENGEEQWEIWKRNPKPTGSTSLGFCEKENKIQMNLHI